MRLNEIESNTDNSCYNKIKLFYFSTRKNLGDALNKDILGCLGAEYCCVDFNEANLVAMGSILHNIITDKKPAKYAYHEYIDVWGSGFIKSNDCEQEYFIKKVNIHALRGKLSKARCEDILGHKLDGIALGDPALLTSRAITVDDVEKKYDVGVIPHYVDRDSDLLNKTKLQNKSYRIIDVQGDTRQICREICECRLILSSALHGLIVADSYGIPNRWIRFSDNIIGGNYKFNDYYSVFNIEGLEPIDLRKEIITDQDIDLFITHYPIKKEAVERIRGDLEKAFPKKRVFDLPMSASYLNEIESKRNKSIEENKHAIDCFDLSIRNLYGGDFKKAEEIISKYRSIINYDSFPKYDRRILENPELSVIIVAYNTRDKLVDCVESLLNNNAGNYEIIIVDNGGNEKAADKLLGFRLLYISSPHNFGPSEGRNIGTYFAKGEIVAFLDDDAIAGKDYVKTIIEIFRKYKIIGLRGKVLPKTNHYNNKEAGHYDLGNNCKFIRYVNAECNSAFSKNEYFKLNGMNPLLFGHEGIELSYRIEKSHGFKKILYSSEIIIYHDYACSDLKYDIKAKRHQVMMSYLKFMHPDIEDFIADIDYFNSDIPSNMNISFSGGSQKSDNSVIGLSENIAAVERLADQNDQKIEFILKRKIPKLIMTLLARDEEDIIRENIEFHLKNGVDFIIATDNASIDNTRDILAEYQKKGKLHLIDEPGRDKSQAVWNNMMTKIAIEKYEADIVFHCDADELWCPIIGDLKTEILKSQNDVMLVNLINIILENHKGEESFPKDARYAAIKPLETSNYEEETRNKNLYFYKYPKKVIFKTEKGLLEVDQGNHNIVNLNENILIGFSRNIFIFHFPIREKRRFYYKVIETGKAVEKNRNLSKTQSFHIRRWFDAYKNGNLDKEYEKLTISKQDAEKLKEDGILADFNFSTFINNQRKENIIYLIQKRGWEEELQQKDQEIYQKEQEILHFKQTVAERDGHIARLGGVVRDKEAQISHLESVSWEKEAALNHIYNSHGWKALKYYYQIRNTILPPQSKRSKLAKQIMKVIIAPFKKEGL